MTLKEVLQGFPVLIALAGFLLFYCGLRRLFLKKKQMTPVPKFSTILGILMIVMGIILGAGGIYFIFSI